MLSVLILGFTTTVSAAEEVSASIQSFDSSKSQYNAEADATIQVENEGNDQGYPRVYYEIRNWNTVQGGSGSWHVISSGTKCGEILDGTGTYNDRTADIDVSESASPEYTGNNDMLQFRARVTMYNTGSGGCRGDVQGNSDWMYEPMGSYGSNNNGGNNGGNDGNDGNNGDDGNDGNNGDQGPDIQRETLEGVECTEDRKGNQEIIDVDGEQMEFLCTGDSNHWLACYPHLEDVSGGVYGWTSVVCRDQNGDLRWTPEEEEYMDSDGDLIEEDPSEEQGEQEDENQQEDGPAPTDESVSYSREGQPRSSLTIYTNKTEGQHDNEIWITLTDQNILDSVTSDGEVEETYEVTLIHQVNGEDDLVHGDTLQTESFSDGIRMKIKANLTPDSYELYSMASTENPDDMNYLIRSTGFSPEITVVDQPEISSETEDIYENSQERFWKVLTYVDGLTKKQSAYLAAVPQNILHNDHGVEFNRKVRIAEAIDQSREGWNEGASRRFNTWLDATQDIMNECQAENIDNCDEWSDQSGPSGDFTLTSEGWMVEDGTPSISECYGNSDYTPPDYRIYTENGVPSVGGNALEGLESYEEASCPSWMDEVSIPDINPNEASSYCPSYLNTSQCENYVIRPICDEIGASSCSPIEGSVSDGSDSGEEGQESDEGDQGSDEEEISEVSGREAYNSLFSGSDQSSPFGDWCGDRSLQVCIGAVGTKCVDGQSVDTIQENGASQDLVSSIEEAQNSLDQSQCTEISRDMCRNYVGMGFNEETNECVAQ